MTAAVHLFEATKTYAGPELPGWAFKSPRSARALVASKPALDHISFRVEPGEIVGVYGQTGAGKTTLIRILAGQLPLDSGEARVFGLDVNRQKLEVARLTNRVSVEASFFKSISAFDNLIHSARASAPDEGGLRVEIEALLARLGLERRRQRLPMEALERNEQQLVAVARAMLSRAKLLLLDEPFAGLDMAARYRVREALLHLRHFTGVTIVFASHSLADVEMLAERMITLSSGRLEADTTPEGSLIWSSPVESCVINA